MNKITMSVLIAGLSCGVLLGAGCAQKARTPDDAIRQSQTLKTAREKADYLVGQAKLYYNSKEFQNAIQTAQYVLGNLDKDSQPAKDLIEKAKAQMSAAAHKAVDEVNKKFFGK